MEKIPLISVKHLVKIYEAGEENLYALNDVSLDINEGEFIAIMGSSGSGKSKIMNIIGLLDEPTSGDYFFNGKSMTGTSKVERAHWRRDHIGFVFQSFNLLPRTTAFDNVELPLIYSSVSKTVRKQKVEEALIAVGLKERMYHLPNKLSGGQQQRVSIARAIVNNPKVLLADEPTGNLDSKISMEIIQIFQQLNDSGITIVMITHEADIGQTAKKRIVFRDGQIVEEQTISKRLIAKEELQKIVQSQAKQLTELQQ
jgi:putative ABC transport system ATP-binding protein